MTRHFCIGADHSDPRHRHHGYFELRILGIYGVHFRVTSIQHRCETLHASGLVSSRCNLGHGMLMFSSMSQIEPWQCPDWFCSLF